MNSRINVRLLLPFIPTFTLLIIGWIQPWGMVGSRFFVSVSLLALMGGIWGMKRQIHVDQEYLKAVQTCHVIKRQRHDWMNHVQVIMGYQMMKQPDKLMAYLQKQIQSANQDRKLSELTYPPLIAQLLTLDQEYPEIQWELKIDESFFQGSSDDEKQLFRLFQKSFPMWVNTLQSIALGSKICIHLSRKDDKVLIRLQGRTENGQVVLTPKTLQDQIGQANLPSGQSTTKWENDTGQWILCLPDTAKRR